VAITEHQLQPIPLGIHLDQLNPVVNQRRYPAQAKRPALRARALAAQFGMIEALLAAIGPVQAQLFFAPGITHRHRVHCS
jgi:putative heme degradation protein